MKTLYQLTKVLCNERPPHSASVLDKEGKIITGKEETMNRWVEHFAEVLNRPKPDNPVSEVNTNPEEQIEDINCDEPSLVEIKGALKMLKNNKAPGIDGIQAELLKADIRFTAGKIRELGR